MRIGELARQVGVSTDTVRFYERSGWLPRPTRRDNDYRDYGEAEAEHLRLLIDLRRLDLPLDEAARIASWCHSGHCADATSELPRLITERRAAIADRIAGLRELDARRRRPRGPSAVRSTATEDARRGSLLRRGRFCGRHGGGDVPVLCPPSGGDPEPVAGK